MYNVNTHIGASFSLKNRIRRLFWNFIYILLFRYSPKPFHSYRSMVLRLFGAKVGKGVHVYPKVVIWAPWNLELDDGCGIANGVNLYSQDKIVIGKRAVISQESYLCAGTHDYTKQGFPLYTRPIIIQSEVWVAAQSFLHPGITVGEGSVIGARSVVTKDVPSWKVCSGFPCNVIKDRKLN